MHFLECLQVWHITKWTQTRKRCQNHARESKFTAHFKLLQQEYRDVIWALLNSEKAQQIGGKHYILGWMSSPQRRRLLGLNQAANPDRDPTRLWPVGASLNRLNIFSYRLWQVNKQRKVSPMSTTTPGKALVVGVTGIVGQTVAKQLVDQGWDVHGISRRHSTDLKGVTQISVDLLDGPAVKEALAGLKPEIVIITAWIRKNSEAENIEVNTATLRNLFAGLEPDGGVRHVALLTGLKHYLGPFDDYATGVMAETPFHESEPRLPNPKKTNSSRHPRNKASPGACTVRTPSLALQ
jgi:hypothetical protein